MTRKIVLCAVLLMAAAGIGACSVSQAPEIFRDDFWANSPLKTNTEAELGLSELGMGNYSAAETHFRKALGSNPKDVYALLGMGIIYQNTGQLVKAREAYEAILALKPDASKRFVVWNTNNTRPISEIASLNLALLNSGEVVAGMEEGAAGQQQEAASVTGAPTVNATMGHAAPGTAAVAADTAATVRSAPAPTVMSALSRGDINVISRFKTLKALRDENLITGAEYTARRQANLGALLPLTAPLPAAGLDRPVPSTEQIAGRLRAIARALEMRAMTDAQHAAERNMILDALMPAAPVAVANPAPPPTGLMEAADAVRRLEALQADRLITADEFARERSAIEHAIEPGRPAKPTVAASKVEGAGAKGTEAVAKGPRPAIHLASYRSRAAADRGWTLLRRTFRELLKGLSPEISQIDLGPGKGIFYRLNAGPLANRGAAEALCDKLKHRRQYCEPTFFTGK